MLLNILERIRVQIFGISKILIQQICYRIYNTDQKLVDYIEFKINKLLPLVLVLPLVNRLTLSVGSMTNPSGTRHLINMPTLSVGQQYLTLIDGG
jgi:hypothetical protein